jgi:hypothetical protein
MIGGLLKSASSAALFAALGLFAMSGGVSPATAADLGGDCCADLEERVAELEATTARKGNRRVSLTISGAVQTSVMYWDNGNNGPASHNSSDVYIVDQVPGTFVQFAGSAAINPNLSAGFQIVLAINSQSRSHNVSGGNDDAGDAQIGAFGNDISTVITVSNWYLDHKQLGRLTVGRANMANAGITTIDLGGAGVIANANIGWWNNSFAVFGGGTGLSWGNLMGTLQVAGASTARGNIVHYTSPTFAGFSVQASAGENNVWDAALRYAGEFSGFRLAAGVGYISNSTGTNEIVQDLPVNAGIDEPSQIKGSASILHVASGLYLTGAYVNQNNDNGFKDSTLWYVQGGIAKNWTGLGNTVLYGEYSNVENGTQSVFRDAATGLPTVSPLAILDSNVDVWGLGIVQHIDAAAMELYLSYRNYSGEVSLGGASAQTDDMNIVLGGARIRF